MDGIRFAVILLTYNRLSSLKTALAKYDEQTKLPTHILVVDNASTDGTEEYLREWQNCPDGKYKRIVVRSPYNGGAPWGYMCGLVEGMKLDCDFLFTADDDAYPEKEMLERLEEGYIALSDKNVSVLCTSVLNRGEYDTSHRERLKKGLLKVGVSRVAEEIYRQKAFSIDIFSWVGAAIKREAAVKTGLPIKDYFMHFEDVEYSLRVGKKGAIYCIPHSIMHHDNDGINDSKVLWKHYYDTRNWIDLVRRHFPRRYYYVAVLEQYLKHCTILAVIFRNRSKGYRKMCMAAIQDAVKNRLGKIEPAEIQRRWLIER